MYLLVLNGVRTDTAVSRREAELVIAELTKQGDEVYAIRLDQGCEDDHLLPPVLLAPAL